MTKAFSERFNRASFFTGLRNKFNVSSAKKLAEAAPAFVVGMGSVMTVKSVCAGATACLAMPGALGTLFAVAAAGVVTGSAVCFTKGVIAHGFNRKAARKAGEDVAPFFSRRNFKDLRRDIKKSFSWKTMGIQMLSASLGGLSASFIEDLVPTNLFASTETPAPETLTDKPQANPILQETEAPKEVLEEKDNVEETTSPTEEPITHLAEDTEPSEEEIEPTIEPTIEPNPLDKVAAFFADGSLEGTPAQEIYERALTGNAQAIKDLAFFYFNGIDCFPTDKELALELYQQAAENGNVQAKTDLAYIQYHGLANVEADTEAALNSMKDADALRIMESAGAKDPLDYWENPIPPLIDDVCSEEKDIVQAVPVPDQTPIAVTEEIAPKTPTTIEETKTVGCDFQPVIVDLEKPIEFICNMGPTHDVQAGDTIRFDAYMHLHNNGGAGSDIHFIPTSIPSGP